MTREDFLFFDGSAVNDYGTDYGFCYKSIVSNSRIAAVLQYARYLTQKLGAPVCDDSCFADIRGLSVKQAALSRLLSQDQVNDLDCNSSDIWNQTIIY